MALVSHDETASVISRDEERKKKKKKPKHHNITWCGAPFCASETAVSPSLLVSQYPQYLTTRPG